MEEASGAFRFTSPTHVMLALHEALKELQASGGIMARNQRYRFLQAEICTCMQRYGFETLVDKDVQSPVITTYLFPKDFNFQQFYDYFKQHGFLLYSGKLPGIDAFRIGNIGHIQDQDITKFKTLMADYYEVNI